MTMSIGLYAFTGMEMLDFAGPYQVFTTANRIAAPDGQDLFSTVVIGSDLGPVAVRGGATVLPQTTIATHPPLTCLILPGGMPAVDAQIDRGDIVEWVAAQAATVPVVASVCTGAFLLAQTGLLSGLEATTHLEHLDHLRQRFPSINVVAKRRWVDTGQFVTAAGLAAGIDMALHLVERLVSHDLSVETARRLEV
jgi:transcriptional regulator GlxA family with amidase domain